VKEPNRFHNYETEKITHKASDAAEYRIKLLGSSTRDHHAYIIHPYMRRRAWRSPVEESNNTL